MVLSVASSNKIIIEECGGLENSYIVLKRLSDVTASNVLQKAI